jgi:hypothetical protein
VPGEQHDRPIPPVEACDQALELDRCQDRGSRNVVPGTARRYVLATPFDLGQAIDAQAQLMRDLLRKVQPRAARLAAYNTGGASAT